jgi:hypothetical protein
MTIHPTHGSDVNDFVPHEYDYTPSTSIPPTAPSIFMSDYPGVDLSLQVSQKLPRSDGGPMEAVKRAIIIALRDALQGTSLGIQATNTQVHINLEYPLKEEQYPGIWIQFQTTKLQRQGLSQEVWQNAGTTLAPKWQAIQEWQFTGRVTLTIMALTSLERDRISDSIISQIAFARTQDGVITMPTDTKQYKSFLTSLYENPYVALTVNTDIINSGGQSVNMGVPWQEDVLAYVDSYSFDLLGQFMYVFNHDGTYTLASMSEYPAPLNEPMLRQPFQADPSTPPVGVVYNVPEAPQPLFPSGDVNP